MFFQEDKQQLKKFQKINNLKFLNNKKILITGCNGFIGSSLIRILFDLTNNSKHKINLYGIVKKKSKITNLILKKLIKLNKIKIFKIDVHEKIKLNFSPDIIIHCASVTAPHMYTKEPVETILTNSLGTINLLNFQSLKSCGLSRQKVKGIKDLAKKYLNKSFNPHLIKKMSDREAIEYLSELRQIGKWSAEMILLFTFNRPNIWPVQDIGLLRAISNNYKKKYFPPELFVAKLYKKFSPYCSVATWYLWRSIDDEPIQY